MIITIKNLQQQTFTIDFDPEKTVLELKKKIFSERGAEYIVDKQKLIYAGIILTDGRTIDSYNVDEKKFIVVMLTRDICGNTTTQASNAPNNMQNKDCGMSAESKGADARTLPAENIPSGSETTEPMSDKTIEKKSETNDSCTETETKTQTQSRSSPVPNDNLVRELANVVLQSHPESNLLMGEAYNQTVSSMIEMGYDRQQVERAMAASFNNPERAVEYLINGIPEEDNSFNLGRINESSRTSNTRDSSSISVDATADPFEFLRSQPQFLQMRSLIYQNPHLLHAVLQQIGQTNPALLQLISENQDAFLNMLNQPLDSEESSSGTAASHANLRRAENLPRLTFSESGAEVHGFDEGAEELSASSVRERDDTVIETTDRVTTETEGLSTIRLTSHDQEAVDRLKALGFPEALVLQAYFACEKDEELAANFLLSSSFDDY